MYQTLKGSKLWTPISNMEIILVERATLAAVTFVFTNQVTELTVPVHLAITFVATRKTAMVCIGMVPLMGR